MDPAAIRIVLVVAAGALLLIAVGSGARIRPEFRILLGGCTLTFSGIAVISAALGMDPGDCMGGGADFGSCITTATAASQVLVVGFALLATAVALAVVGGVVAVRQVLRARRG